MLFSKDDLDSHKIEEQHKDMVDYIAEEKEETKQAVIRRKVTWQISIFLLAFVINFLISFRDFFITDIVNLEPDQSSVFALNICRGIGYLIIGNLYDNVHMPKRLTYLLLMLLCIFTCLVSINNQ